MSRNILRESGFNAADSLFTKAELTKQDNTMLMKAILRLLVVFLLLSSVPAAAYTGEETGWLTDTDGAVTGIIGTRYVYINKGNFPDNNFRTWLREADNTTGSGTDGLFTEDEIAGITAVNCSGQSISSLQGINFLTSLRVLICSGNSLKTLDVSPCAELEGLQCDNNELTELIVNSCANLDYIDCHSNQLASLDLSGIESLHYVDCALNLLTSLDVSGCVSLETLVCASNQLTSFNAKSLTNLKQLICPSNQLVSLDLSECLCLAELNCLSNSTLKDLDLSNTKLRKNTSYDSFELIFGEQMPSLRTLKMINCTEVTGDFDLMSSTRFPELRLLDVSGSYMSSITAYKRSVFFGGSTLQTPPAKVTSLIAVGCPKLTSVVWPSTTDITQGALTSIDLSGCDLLHDVVCQGQEDSRGPLSMINLEGCVSLCRLFCPFNRLSALDLSDCHKLELLSCDCNELTVVRMPHPMPMFNTGQFRNNHLNALDLTHGTLAYKCSVESSKFSWYPNGRKVKAECAKMGVDDQGNPEYLYYLRLDNNYSSPGEKDIVGRMMEDDPETGTSRSTDFNAAMVRQWISGGEVYQGAKAARVLRKAMGVDELSEDQVVGEILVLTPDAGSEQAGKPSGRVTYTYDTGYPDYHDYATLAQWTNEAAYYWMGVADTTNFIATQAESQGKSISEYLEIAMPFLSGDIQKRDNFIDNQSLDEHNLESFFTNGMIVPCYIDWEAEVDEDGTPVITGIGQMENPSMPQRVIYYDSMGRASRHPVGGVNIVVTRYSDGSTSVRKVIQGSH